MLKKTDELSMLWDEVCTGNQRAYSILHQQLYPILFTRGKRILKDDELTAEVLQDTFIKLWLKKETIGPLENVKGYFFIAMRFACIDYLRNVEALKAKKDVIVFFDFQNSIEDVITEREVRFKQRMILEGALNKLPARQCEIMRLRFFENLNCTEIGKVTGIKYQSVVNHLYKAVQTLRGMYSSEDELLVA